MVSTRVWVCRKRWGYNHSWTNILRKRGTNMSNKGNLLFFVKAQEETNKLKLVCVSTKWVNENNFLEFHFLTLSLFLSYAHVFWVYSAEMREKIRREWKCLLNSLGNWADVLLREEKLLQRKTWKSVKYKLR